MTLKDIEREAFLRFYPNGHLHVGVDTPETLAEIRGAMEQRLMLEEYARRKANGEFPDGPEVNGG